MQIQIRGVRKVEEENNSYAYVSYHTANKEKTISVSGTIKFLEKEYNELQDIEILKQQAYEQIKSFIEKKD